MDPLQKIVMILVATVTGRESIRICKKISLYLYVYTIISILSIFPYWSNSYQETTDKYVDKLYKRAHTHTLQELLIPHEEKQQI